MTIATFKLKSTSPLLMNNPSSMQIDEGKLKGRKGRIPTPEEEVKLKFYECQDGQLFIPSAAFRAAVITACKGMKIGKFSAVQQAKAGVFVVEDECRLFNSAKPLRRENATIDTRRAVIKKQGVMRSRPRIENWICEVTFDIDENYISIEQVADRLQAAGKYPGVLDYRPENSGAFGRFEIEE